MDKKDGLSPKAKISLFYLALVLGAGVAILWSMIKVQWVDGEVWRAKSKERTRNYQVEQAHRGNIYSSDGKILATTVPVCDLYLDFGRRPDRDKKGKVKRNANGDTILTTPIVDSCFNKYLDSACIILHRALPDSSVAAWKNKLTREREAKKPKGCLMVMRAMPYTDWMALCKLPGWGRGVVRWVDGKSVIHNLRFHAYGNLAESVIGFRYSYTRDEYSGLEGYYDSILRGQDGLILCRRLTRGLWLPMKEGDGSSTAAPAEPVGATEVDVAHDPEHPTIDGQHIISTIDTRLQDIAHYSLESTLMKLGGSAGCAILMEVETGNILVCSSLVRDTSHGNPMQNEPLSNTQKSQHLYRESPNRNVPLSDLYEPGSIFKPVLLTAIYNDPTVALDTAMQLPVGVKRFSAKSKEVKDHGLPNGMFPLWKAVAVSSNVAFCELGWRFYNSRRDTLLSAVRNIFPYEKLDVDLRGPENRCRVNPLTSDNDFLRFCYGYTSSVSPLRMATFYNAIANKGRMVKPRFCQAIIKDGVREELPVQVIREKVCSEETALTIRDLLTGVVEGGTGDNIKNDTYTIAGKTGTAETAPGALTSNVTFVGFFPADNPKYTCLVMLRDVHSFGRNAAPVFQNIADCVVSIDKELDCRPTVKIMDRKDDNSYRMPTAAKAPQADVRRAHRRLGLDYSNVTMRAKWCTFQSPVDSMNIRAAYIPYRIPKGQVPNCYGMTVKDALLLCRSMGLDVTFEGYGKVVSQEPKARTPIKKGTTVHLYVK